MTNYLYFSRSVILMLSGSATKSRPRTTECWPLKPGQHQNKCSRKNQYWSTPFWHPDELFFSNDEPFDIFLASWQTCLRNGEMFDVLIMFFTPWRTLWLFWYHDKLFVVMKYFGLHDKLFYIMTNFLLHDKLLTLWQTFLRHDVFLILWQFFWHHDVFLTSWRTFFSNDEPFDIFLASWQTCLRNGEIFDVLIMFFTPWRTLWLFWYHDKLFVVMKHFGLHDKLFYIMTNFLLHDKLLTLWQMFLRHDVLLILWQTFWHHDVFLTSWRTFF